MIRRIDLRGTHVDARTTLPRAAMDVADASAVIAPILEDVRTQGASAVAAWSAKLDGVAPPTLRVPAEKLAQAEAELDPKVRAALLEAIRRARLVHADQRRVDVETIVVPGGTVTERWIPVSRVGLYVPGGRAVYPSSVIMNVVPAQVAGVQSLVVVSPPQKDCDGWPHPTILAACSLLGVEEVYAVGGAQAVAMLAYGVELEDGTRCAPVDLVTGPGNIYVTAAKRSLQGVIGIDSEAGPTEVAILADDSANAAHVAADLISQAEHDPMAAAVLVTPSVALADAVIAEVERQVPLTKHIERITTALKGEQSAVVLVDSLEEGLELVNQYAAEHLEIHTVNAREWAMRVRNAGAIFVGAYAPVSLGDYAAGSNHVLPTAGAARHSSGLSVQSFLRGVHVIEYDEPALRDVAEHVIALSHAEDLPGHGAAIAVRFTEQS
ncbi:MAG: histidinol dehydrogenase [Actinobacteria bacterium]|nr:histidinol dehydrogenase [Actinomycetota bacterium]MSZ41759.1 histidinol dehydrogenase [Actinomycetota bacterium]